MRLAIALALLWQLGALETPGSAADPQHLRYERAIVLPPGTVGQVCVALDASVFAHAASVSGNDLRVFAEDTGGRPAEVPFSLSESESQPVEVESADVRNLGLRGGDLVFDLEMPHRAYTDVELDLAAKNFFAVASVNGSDGRGGPVTALGSFALFDLSRQGLSRSTVLPLQESSFAELQVRLHVTGLDGEPMQGLSAAMVRGADVPPSREAQTLYTTVAQTETIEQRGRQSLAGLQIAAHVPVERVAFVLEPGYAKNFLRAVNITATPITVADREDVESVQGEISRVRLTEESSEPAIDSRQLAVEATLGASRKDGANVEVAIENGDDPPLALKAVLLQMRRRMICFDAVAGAAYMLRYGDVALHAPVYDYARLFQPSAKAAVATLETERMNPKFVARADERPYTERHPELLWIGLLAVVAGLGTTALQSVRRLGRRR